MTIGIMSVVCGGTGPVLPHETATLIDNTANLMTPCQAYQKALEYTKADILVMLHDDVEVYDEHWCLKLRSHFFNPNCVAAGFGGATSLGRPDLYRKPWNIWNMARGGYASNQTDAEIHGERFTGVRRVAVLDAFCMAVRVQWLRDRGGWPVEHISHHCLDLWLACEAARDGKEIMMTGVDCLHRGGATSVSKKYAEAEWLQGGTLVSDHIAPHLWLYNSYRDILPITL